VDGEEKNFIIQINQKNIGTKGSRIVSAYERGMRFGLWWSLKAETHFPTTVEPFRAATGSGGEIRDRLAGGQGSLPLAGTAVYMTSYSRLTNNRNMKKRWRNVLGCIKRQWIF
jgi:phosphoribosylformylglycinamidine (FGAM) synthase-like enzyme